MRQGATGTVVTANLVRKWLQGPLPSSTVRLGALGLEEGNEVQEFLGLHLCQIVDRGGRE
jgi:hypothetical protein